LLGEWGIPKDSPAGRRQLERALEARREEDDAEFNLVRGGWCLGDETFRQELLVQMRETIDGALKGSGPSIAIGSRFPAKLWLVARFLMITVNTWL